MHLQAVFYSNPDRYPPIINGARLLADAGFTLEIFCRADREKWEVKYPPGVRIHRIGSSSRNSWLEYSKFIATCFRLASRDARVFIGHDMHGLLVARLLGTAFRRPVVFQSHELNDMSQKLSLGMKMVRSFQYRFARTASLVIVADRDRGRISRRDFNLRQEPLVAVNAPLAGQDAGEERLRRTLHEKGYSFDRILFRQGGIGPSHAIESTIRSLPYWSGRNWGFVIMGQGEPDYLCSLDRLASELNVADRFVILPAVSYDEVSSFTSGADVGHSLYTAIDSNNAFSTTASNKLMEYMKAGLPVLVSDRPSQRAFITKYGCGVAANEDAPNSIAQAVNTLLSDPVLARRMGAAAAQAFREEFCFERQFAPVVDIISRLASPNGKGTPC
jgi:glycosyltransferase involved in cell wall biosynthesis